MEQNRVEYREVQERYLDKLQVDAGRAGVTQE